MAAAWLVLLLVCYLVLRDRMPPSLWEQAPDLQGYLLGAMGPPLLDLLAVVAVALFSVQHYHHAPRLTRMVAIVGVAAALVATVRSLRPLWLDLREARPQEGIIVQRLPGQVVVIQPSTTDPATSSWRVPNTEQYRRVPDRFPVEFLVAPRTGVAQVVGALE